MSFICPQCHSHGALDIVLTMCFPADVRSDDIPEIAGDDGSSVRVICGEFGGRSGPVEGIAAAPRYLDVTLPADTSKVLPVESTHTVFAYVFEGSGIFGEDAAENAETETADNRCLVRLGSGDEIAVRASGEGIRFLLVSGKPLKEPVAWHGPIVMNTQEELQQAFRELNQGTFLKKE